ncbi:carbamate kinase [bacterium]|nr:carbamate kinase [bacterium]
MMSRIVIAIGGNSLIKDKQHQTVADQFDCIMETADHITELIKAGHDVVITHGNGPQVGFILLRAEIASKQLHSVPLDACGADTQGAIGYALQRAVGNILRKKGITDRQAVTLVTQVLVDKDDDAFKNPSKPIGPFYTKEEIEEKKNLGWAVVEDAGRGYRRIVASPLPVEIIEINAIKKLLDENFIVVCVGGGGIPVIKDEKGDITGVAAVIDKDNASALLAGNIQADVFIVATAVEKVALNFGKPDQKELDHITVEQAKEYMAAGHFAPGSMLPKIKAVIDYLEAGGKRAIITNPENLSRAVQGKAGTTITRNN